MSRRRKVDKRETRPDTLYGDKVLSKFINIVMVNGMKSKSEKIVYDALDAAAYKLKVKSPIDDRIKHWLNTFIFEGTPA